MSGYDGYDGYDGYILKANGGESGVMATLYTYQNNLYTAAELAKIATNGITPEGLRYRLRRGYSIQDAITQPLMKRPSSVKYPCGATTWRDCLECKVKIMRCLNYPAFPGENAGEWVDAEYKKRRAKA